MFLGCSLPTWLTGPPVPTAMPSPCPMAALVAMLVLVTGQTVLAHVLDADNVLSVIIEFLGGLTLIALIISSRRRS